MRQFLEDSDNKERMSLRILSRQFISYDGMLYKRMPTMVHLICVDKDEAQKLMEAVHEGVCRPYMNRIIMAKKVLIYIAGSLLLAPCFIALCCDSLLLATFAIIYGVVLYHSPKFSTRIRKFWFNFWKISIKLTNIYEVR